MSNTLAFAAANPVVYRPRALSLSDGRYMLHFDDNEKVEVGFDAVKLCAEHRGPTDSGKCRGKGPKGRFVVGDRVEYRFDGDW